MAACLTSNNILKRPCLKPTSKVPDLPHPALVRTLIGHVDIVVACAISADGATIVSASADETLKVWDGRSGKCLATLHVDGPLSGCDYSADGEVIAATGVRGIYFLRLVR